MQTQTEMEAKKEEEKAEAALTEAEAEVIAPIKKHWGWVLASGIAMIVLGIAAISTPFIAATAFAMVLGALLLICGITQAVYAVSSRTWGGFFPKLLVAALYVFAGMTLMMLPAASVVTLTLVLGVFLILKGIVRTILSFQLRPLPRWGWVLFNGLAGLALGALIVAQWPSDAVWAIGLLLGIDLTFGGWSLMTLALAARTAPQPATP